MLAGFDFLCNAGTDKDRDGTRIIVFTALLRATIGETVSEMQSARAGA